MSTIEMSHKITAADIQIRTDLLPGDLGYVAYLHGLIYSKELNYGFNFERYTFQGLHEFSSHYDPEKDRVWICEHEGKIVGFLMGFHRTEETIQLRFFILLPEYRAFGLGKRLMDLFMAFMKEKGYSKAYLWTTNEQLPAVSLYTKYGFQLTREKASVAFDKELTELRFDIDLKN